MAEKEIALLKSQIERLEEKKFDLEAWKNQTIVFLERVFGKESSKIRMIRELHYDYSSWNLRDAAGLGKSQDPVRFQARQILEAAVEELEKIGLPGEKAVNDKLRDLLRDELTGKQMKEIENLLLSDDPDRAEKIATLLETLEKEHLAVMLSKLLLP